MDVLANPLMAGENLTPMIKQYLQIKQEYPDVILLYRIGDFYEMFFEDAQIASKLLDITLTSRNKNDPNPVPLCGVPHHSVEPYIAKLISKGRKVAICDQVEDPRLAQGVVKREVTRVITPGIVLESGSMESRDHNFIASVVPKGFCNGEFFGLAVADVSTGHFSAAQFDSADALAEEILRLAPREILLPVSIPKENEISSKIVKNNFEPLFTNLEDKHFEPSSISNLEGASSLITNSPWSARAASAIWSYIEQTQKSKARHIRRIETSGAARTMGVDESTKRNLEIFATMADGSLKGSLVSVLDRTRTAFGARKLREWLQCPLLDIDAINFRLDAVEFILKANLAAELPEKLSQVYDIERLGARIAMGTATARDLAAIKESFKITPLIIDAIKDKKGKVEMVEELLGALDPLTDVASDIEKTLVDEPPLSIKEGGFIRDGVSKELDQLRDISGGGKDSIAKIEVKERGRTGISSLKVKYNKVFGYYIEITNAHKDKVPADYIRKQTLVNAERYITPELKEYEEKVLSAEERIKALEYGIFIELRERVAGHSERITKTASALAALDVLTSFAVIAGEYRYTRPVVNNSKELHIKDGRHPIIERLNPIERFVPNDTNLDEKENQLIIITGPNMAGKSTVMRQTAIIVLMAQIGSFVPAKEASIGLVDRIFTRIGASDALACGQSTFMVEMNEAAIILNKATPRSLIIIDEIGRGTSTFDGLSIAWAVAEDIHDRVKARTLFATHYHELTELVLTKEGIKNYNIAVKEWNGEVIFLRKLVPGATSRSYGIQVAKLAGLPTGVIERSHEILRNLEAGEFDEVGTPRLASHKTTQLDLFSRAEDPRLSEIAKKLNSIDTSTLTPIEALNILHELKQKVD